jgi:predicted acyl esterase
MMSGHAEALINVPLKFEYTLAPFETETEMVGSSEFTLFISCTTSADVDLLVRTFDVAPDGTETEVTVGGARVTGLATGEVRPVSFKDYGDDWVFGAGHSLRIRVSNIDFPTFRPPGANDNMPLIITIHTGRKRPSRLVLPVRVR